MSTQQRFGTHRLSGDGPGLAIALALAFGASCGGDGTALPESGAVLLSVTIPSNEATPDELRAWVYDRKGVLFKSARVPAQGPLPARKGTKMGTILIQPGARSVGDLRIHLRGYVTQQRRLDGIVVVTAELRDQPTVEVVMSSRIPADIDLDDVPDVIDDCLPGFNPDQGGCVATGSADGSADAGTRDGSGSGPDVSVEVGRGSGGAGVGGGSGAAGSAGNGAGGATGMGGTPGAGGTAGGSSGCGTGVSGAAEGYVTLVMNEGGAPVNRQYWLSRPIDYSAQRTYKVVIALGSPASSVDAVRQQISVQGSGAAGASDEIFVYPLARVRTFGSWGTSFGWQLGPGARDTNAAGLDDLAFIDAVYGDVTGRFCVDTRRVFAVGYGWGSDFANALACVRGDLLRAVAGAANNGDYYVTNPVVACRGQVGNWVLQGKGDTRLGLRPGVTTLSYWFNRHACSRNTRPLTVAGPNGNEDCVGYNGCTAETRWCAYDASFGAAAPSYLGREALGFFRGF